MKAPSGPELHLLLALALASCAAPPASPAGQAVTPQLHSELYFPIVEGQHALDCADCHLDDQAFGRYQCIQCHAHERDRAYAAHFSITENFVYQDGSCYACHPRGQGPRFDHQRFFPIREGARHAGTACIQCHPNTADRHEVTCLDCHLSDPTGSQHQDVEQGASGYERVSGACLGCHPDSAVYRVASHLPFHLSSGFPHHRVACRSCHRQVLPNKPSSADFTSFECLECHPRAEIDPVHAGQADYRYDNFSCLASGCHQQGTRSD